MSPGAATMSDSDLDLIVIGSGPAGEKGAAQAAYFGHRVAIVERQARPGGAPVNSGGLPTKTLRETALYLTGFRRRDLYGIGIDLAADLTLERMRKRAAAVSEVAGRAVRANIERHGIELVQGTARLAGDRSVEVSLEDGGTRTLRAQAHPHRHRLTAVPSGGRAVRRPGRPRLGHDPRASTPMPASLVVIGGGPVGCEYASIFMALGRARHASSIVPTGSCHSSTPTPPPSCATCLTDMGMRLMLGSPHATVGRVDGRLQVSIEGGETLETDAVLYRGRTERQHRGARPRGGSASSSTHAAASSSTPSTGPPCPASTPPATSSGRRPSPRSRPSRAAWRCATPSTSRSRRPSTRCRPSASTRSPRWPWWASPRKPPRPRASMRLPVATTSRTTRGASSRARPTASSSSSSGATTAASSASTSWARRRPSSSTPARPCSMPGETIDRFIHSTFNIPTRAEAYKYAAYDGLQQLGGQRLRRCRGPSRRGPLRAPGAPTPRPEPDRSGELAGGGGQVGPLGQRAGLARRARDPVQEHLAGDAAQLLPLGDDRGSPRAARPRRRRGRRRR